MPKKDHWWINPSGLNKADKDKLRKATSDYEQSTRKKRSTPPAVIPNQYIGQGPEAKKAAEKLAKQLKGAKVYAETFGAQSQSQKLWERVAHSLIDMIFKGRK